MSAKELVRAREGPGPGPPLMTRPLRGRAPTGPLRPAPSGTGGEREDDGTVERKGRREMEAEWLSLSNVGGERRRREGVA